MAIVASDIERYAEEHSSPPPPYLEALAEDTRATLEVPQMMVGPLEGRFLEVLVFALRPRLVLEIGTFSGYSALSMAAGLPPGGRILTCEIDPKAAAMAHRHIAASPFADRIEVRLGPALDTIGGLDGPFDFVFIDADKTSYVDYYEAVLPKLAGHGMIAVDNVLWDGRVLDAEDTSDSAAAIRRFNDHVRHDSRVACVMCTIRDGVTLVRKAAPARA
jgi:caffeoyl-CoA O-methyltransferase